MRFIIPATFSSFGIVLKKLKYNDLPLLMSKHNDQSILPFMDDPRQVSLPVLEFWLKKTETYGLAFPYIAYWQNNPIAYIELRNCNFERGTCEDGIFLYDSEQFGRHFGSRIWLCRENLLRALNIRDVVSRIRSNNVRSIHFFQKMGGKYVKTEDDFLIYIQTFHNRMKALRLVAKQLNLQEEFSKNYDYIFK